MMTKLTDIVGLSGINDGNLLLLFLLDGAFGCNDLLCKNLFHTVKDAFGCHELFELLVTLAGFVPDGRIDVGGIEFLPLELAGLDGGYVVDNLAWGGGRDGCARCTGCGWRRWRRR
jgi:hypothetical protein